MFKYKEYIIELIIYIQLNYMIIEMKFSNFYAAHEAVDCPSPATINLRYVLHSVH